MEGPSNDHVFSRIEAALARIEAAALSPRDGDPALAQRHERLRDAVSRTLRDLDTLIAGRQA